MTITGAKRGRGRPAKLGSPLAELDELLKSAPPHLLAKFKANRGMPNPFLPNPAQAAETLARDWGKMLEDSRPARARKRTESERAKTQSRAERLRALGDAIALWPNKSARNIADIIVKQGRFADTSLETLRKDIAAIRHKNLGMPS